MKRVLLAGVIAFLIVVLPSCSTVRVRPIAAGDTTTEGVRFYRPEPYLLVGKDGAASIVYLPDLSVGYAITQSDGFGGRSLKVTLADGWRLTEVGAETGAIPDKVVELLGSAIGATKGETKMTGQTLEYGLYRIVRRGDSVKLEPVKP